MIIGLIVKPDPSPLVTVGAVIPLPIANKEGCLLGGFLLVSFLLAVLVLLPDLKEGKFIPKELVGGGGVFLVYDGGGDGGGGRLGSLILDTVERGSKLEGLIGVEERPGLERDDEALELIINREGLET